MVQMFQATPGQHDFRVVRRMRNMRPPAVSLIRYRALDIARRYGRSAAFRILKRALDIWSIVGRAILVQATLFRCTRFAIDAGHAQLREK